MREVVRTPHCALRKARRTGKSDPRGPACRTLLRRRDLRHAARLESLGLGRRVPWANLDSKHLRAALGEVLQDTQLQQRARDFAHHAKAGGERLAADEIEATYLTNPRA